MEFRKSVILIGKLSTQSYFERHPATRHEHGSENTVSAASISSIIQIWLSVFYWYVIIMSYNNDKKLAGFYS